MRRDAQGSARTKAKFVQTGSCLHTLRPIISLKYSGGAGAEPRLSNRAAGAPDSFPANDGADVRCNAHHTQLLMRKAGDLYSGGMEGRVRKEAGEVCD